MDKKLRVEYDHHPFAKAWKKRLVDRRAYLTALRKKAHHEAEWCASILCKEYKVKKVFLFGSLPKGIHFTERSDIDLAVEGLKEKLFFDAIGKLLQDAKFNISIVRLEDCEESLKKQIFLKGELLYEKASQ